jgi:hypothetical protein
VHWAEAKEAGMAGERRYRDDEVARIFEAAASPERLPRGQVSEGLTLAELQAIGSEAGMSPGSVAAAAAALDRATLELPRRRYLGIPVGVSRTSALPRAPTDAEWEQLVAELRQAFGAEGVVRTDGNLRTWRNGNLRASVEPGEGGYQLRLRTVRGNAIGYTNLGIGLLVLTVLLYFAGELAGEPDTGMLLAGVGAAMLAWNAVRQPGWASQREAQMEHIGAVARALIHD